MGREIFNGYVRTNDGNTFIIAEDGTTFRTWLNIYGEKFRDKKVKVTVEVREEVDTIRK